MFGGEIKVGATTGKQPVVIKGNGSISRVTQYTRIMAHPDFTGIFCFTEFARKTATLLKK